MCKLLDFSKLCFILISIRLSEVRSISELNKQMLFLDTIDPEKEVADFIFSKGYIPKQFDMPKGAPHLKVDNDASYILSKLSDDDLIQLLNNPKKEFDLNDIAQVSNSNDMTETSDHQDPVKTRFRAVHSKPLSSEAFFKLDHKPVEPYESKFEVDPHYNAHQSLNNMLYSRPLDRDPEDDETKKELLFDVLITQLKALCCKKKEPVKVTPDFKPLLDDFKPNSVSSNVDSSQSPYMFLIINDDISSNGSDGVISVDPESLDGNSSALLLGPIHSPLTDAQLKLVMNRITFELSKPEYLPLLTQISEGSLSDSNIKIVKSLVTGPETRRYIKPHRCNHVSKLAKVYGGPKWVICTGYININTPSLYDKNKFSSDYDSFEDESACRRAGRPSDYLSAGCTMATLLRKPNTFGSALKL